MGILVRMMDLPLSIKGFVKDNDDGTYTIVLNSKYSYEQNCRTYNHELRHIFNDDLDQPKLAREIEAMYV